MILDVLEELSQAKEEEIAEEENKKYREYLANHWINKLMTNQDSDQTKE